MKKLRCTIVKYIRQSNDDILSAKKVLRKVENHKKFKIYTFRCGRGVTSLMNSVFQLYEQQQIKVFYYRKREIEIYNNSIIVDLIASMNDEHGKKLYIDVWICEPKCRNSEIFGNVFVVDESNIFRYAQNLRKYQDMCFTSSGTIHKTLFKKGLNDFETQQGKEERNGKNDKDDENFQELIEGREFCLFEKFLEQYSDNIPNDISGYYALNKLAANLGSIDLEKKFEFRRFRKKKRKKLD